MGRGQGESNRYSAGLGASKSVTSAGKGGQMTKVARAARGKFEEIKKQCLASGKLYEDPDFPATGSSIYYSTPTNFEWKRPKELCDNPQMFVGGASRFDVKQGDLGNCWFLAAVASLCASKNDKLLHQVVPLDNSFDKDYCGAVHFKLWQYGEWLDVVVDDRLPTNGGALMFMHSADPNEFWSALLEKAYAKLNGSYEALQGGSSAEAMEDFTGGIVETYDFKKGVPQNLFTVMRKAYERSSLMGCTIDAQPGQIEAVLGNGLVMGHAYSITGVYEVPKAQLVRVRNPWGNQYEWKGAWADDAPEWNSVPDKVKKELGISKDDDGEFFMSFQDFTSNFQKMEICNLTPDSFANDPAKKKKWECSLENGSWVTRVNAGGCRNFLDTFWTNPQYRVDVCDADDDDNEDMGTLIIGLMQKERRKKRAAGTGDLLTIGYMIYKLKDANCGPLDLNFFKFNQAVGRSPAFSNMREICGRHRLAPGQYCVVPCTFKPNEDAEFLVRIFSEKPAPATEIDEETGCIEDDLTDIEAAKRREKFSEVTEADVEEEKNVRRIFKETSGEDLEVDAYELREILDANFKKDMKLRPRFKFDGFSLETCRSLVAMKDDDHSGKLGYEEFKELWADLRKWKKVFKQFDEDESGFMNSIELRNALRSVNYKVANGTFNCLVMRYSGPQGRIYFDDFMLCVARLKTMLESYKQMPQGKFTQDQFVQLTMYS